MPGALGRWAGFSRNNLVWLLATGVCCVGLWLLDLRPPRSPAKNEKAEARVLTVDDSQTQSLGLVVTGCQRLRVKIISGIYAGREFAANNQLRADMELDKFFRPGDRALVVFPENGVNEDTVLTAQDHYRMHYVYALCGALALLLVCFAGAVGVKALMSLVFSCLALWQLVIPLCLRGFNPVVVCLAAVLLLTAFIIFIIGGFTRKGFTAFAGSMLGVGAGCWLGALATGWFKINGATMPYSQALLYSGYEFLSLPDIFIGAIFLASSGAMMDLAMDVAAGMEEVKLHRPDISRGQLLLSGIRIGRSVVGTMTTTLFLAYSGGYLTLMMAFMCQGTALLDFINNPYVAAEMVKTIVGSFGLVLVAPATAAAGAVIYFFREKSA